MKKVILLVAFSITWVFFLTAQDSGTDQKPVNSNRSLLGYFILEDSRPIRNPYESGILIDNQTNVIPTAKTLEFVIQHRFGSLENGFSDFLGIYGAANTRLALNYSITDWAQVGFGTTKNYKLQDFSAKINILKQSRDKKSPVDVTYYGNWAIDARDKDFFGEDYQFSSRFSFFNELLITRQFTDWLTLSAGGSFSHFNAVDTLVDQHDHDKIALHFLGRVKFSPQSSIIINFDLPLQIDGLNSRSDLSSHYNFGIGYEVATATHAFQIFAGTGTYLVPQYNVMKNDKEFFKGTGNIFLGFNITRLWSF